MCEGFLLAASAPLFSFVYTLYATMTGDGVASQASEAAKKIKLIGNLNDQQFRAAHQILKGYGSNIILVTGLIATVLSYLTALLSSSYVLGRSAVFDLMIISAPVLLLIFCVMVLNSVGPANLSTHKILAPFTRWHGKVTLPFTYSALINGAATLCNALLIIVFAFSYGVISCRPAKDSTNAKDTTSLSRPAPAPRTDSLDLAKPAGRRKPAWGVRPEMAVPVRLSATAGLAAAEILLSIRRPGRGIAADDVAGHQVEEGVGLLLDRRGLGLDPVLGFRPYLVGALFELARHGLGLGLDVFGLRLAGGEEEERGEEQAAHSRLIRHQGYARHPGRDPIKALL